MRDTAAKIARMLGGRDGAPAQTVRRRDLRDAYKRVFESDDGRLVLGDLARYGAFQEVFVPENVYETHVNIGMQRLIRRIAAMCALTDQQIYGAVMTKIDGDRRAAEEDAA